MPPHVATHLQFELDHPGVIVLRKLYWENNLVQQPCKVGQCNEGSKAEKAWHALGKFMEEARFELEASSFTALNIYIDA